MLTGWRFRLVITSVGYIEPLERYTVYDYWINDQMKHPEGAFVELMWSLMLELKEDDGKRDILLLLELLMQLFIRQVLPAASNIRNDLQV